MFRTIRFDSAFGVLFKAWLWFLLIALPTILAFILQGCTVGTGFPSPLPFVPYADSELRPYLDEFVMVSETVSPYLDMRFVPPPVSREEPEAIGQCWDHDGYQEVTIDWEWWHSPERSDADLRAVVWHELGHCILAREHTTGLLADQCPSSLMNEWLPSTECMVIHWGFYFREMFE